MHDLSILKKYLLLVLSSLCLCCVAVNSDARLPTTDLFFSNFDPQDLSLGTVQVIRQDDEGYMWFGGVDGLVKFDGYNYKNYHQDKKDSNNLSSNSIWDILVDRAGKIWIATDVGLDLYDPVRDAFVSMPRLLNRENPLDLGSPRSLVEDNQGNIWIGTTQGLFILDANRENLSQFQPNEDESVPLANAEIRKIYLDNSKSILWIGTYSTGLSKLDLVTHQVTNYAFNSSNNSGLNHFNITSLYQDDSGLLWIGTEGGGVSSFDPDSATFKTYLAEEGSPTKLSSNVVTSILEIKNGNLLIATEWGLNFFDKQSGVFKQYFSDLYYRESLSSSNIQSLFKDKNGDVWLGYFPTGVGFLNTSNLAFRTYRINPGNQNSLNAKSILAVHESPNDIIWLGTDGGGLNKFNLNTNTFIHYPKGSDRDSINAGAILDIADYKDGQLILGTWSGGLNIFNPATGKVVKRYESTRGDTLSLSNNNTWSVLFDGVSNLYIGTIGSGLDILAMESNSFTHYNNANNSENVSIIWKVFRDSKGTVWVGTNSGLGILNSTSGTIDLLPLRAQELNVSSDIVIDITEDRNGNIWIATRYNGLYFYNPNTKTFVLYDKDDGLPSNKTRSLIFDENGILWVGTDKGLAKFNITSQTIVTYTASNGLQGNVFNFGAALLTSKNELIFGGTNGFTIFDPNTLEKNSSVPPVAITELHVFNQPVIAGDGNSILSKDISVAEEITLEHSHSVFTLFFTAMSYRNSDENKFAYMLQGFEKNWNYVDSDRRSATYTNLPPGSYIFKVKASNNDGLWNDVGARLKIIVLPPPWRTWWAYFGYVVALLSIIALFIQSQKKKVLVLEKMVKARTYELENKNQELEEAYGKLKTLSLTDPLTGLNNRRFLNSLIDRDMKKNERGYLRASCKNSNAEENDFIFLLLDVDHFKSVNDKYGHSAGDQVIIDVAEILKNICRETDFLVRWGGEEFLIVIRYVCRAEAPLIADRIRQKIEQYQFKLPNGEIIKKTCSVGFAFYPFIESRPLDMSWENIIDIADAALYAAKRSGRNRCVGIAATQATTTHEILEKLTYDLEGMVKRNEIELISVTNSNLNFTVSKVKWLEG